MKLLAKELCGKHIGKTVTFLHPEWIFNEKRWESVSRSGPILMITHKKNGDVNIRVGKAPDLAFGCELAFRAGSEVNLS